ncbi:Dihydrodipicolinate synthase/N-acetylneuraminatelyase [Halalkaliarchaeum sp. AArc-CO]|uniref:dihydrodipicolinate synthase family protein n=1 Tax=Halalkaliarchaeum sp. AArc-CO TaxID=2866381 RepID=UPI00217CD514|nr:dihydrodipicolinate synthase family protein [Halalkaliarchaeum sp. AArc-CO]UWG51803.1 Dihydrodipicolinate synthase/N-acetylneuraminatelyase [Halalkaliarchaeum sp. AArc-CO]
MNGIGPPLVTPFDEAGDVDYGRLRELVDWIESRGVDFLVPCGSNSEAELMTAGERTRVIETVVEEASVPVVAGTGSPGLRETLSATRAAADAGADAALVVTPFYYDHDQATLEAYYRELAGDAPLPIYLYSVPAYTGVRLEPDTVGRLATHPNVVGMKDSHASLPEFVRTKRRVAEAIADAGGSAGEFDLLIGSGSVLAQALSAGGVGGVLALANLAPAATVEVFEAHRNDPERARRLNEDLVELNTAITADYGVPGLKWAMRERDAPAGYPRSPHREPDAEARGRLQALLAEL